MQQWKHFGLPHHITGDRAMKYLEHRSQAERLALAEALEATLSEDADISVYVSAERSRPLQGRREPMSETD
jgi:hypothetical protein